MNAIAAVSRSWGIGCQNKLLFHIPADLQRFRHLTVGGTLIMGRKTFESLPGGKPLPDRRHIILSRNPDFEREGIEVAHSIRDVFALTADSRTEELWICGGGEIYRAFLPYCSRCYLTYVDADPPYDACFPALTSCPEWTVTDDGGVETDGVLRYRFVNYKNRAPAEA